MSSASRRIQFVPIRTSGEAMNLRHLTRVHAAEGQVASGAIVHSISRRDFLRLTLMVLASPGSLRAAAPADSKLRARRLAWAGIQLQLPSGSLCLDPLTNKDVWGDALKDAMIPVG